MKKIESKESDLNHVQEWLSVSKIIANGQACGQPISFVIVAKLMQRLDDLWELMTETEQEQCCPNDVSPSVSEAAVIMGRIGGKVGGPARAVKLTSERRSVIAKQGAASRWNKKAL